MNAKALVARLFVLVGLLTCASSAFAQQSPPDSDEAKQIVALVDKAAALVNAKGKAALPIFGKMAVNGDMMISTFLQTT